MRKLSVNDLIYMLSCRPQDAEVRVGYEGVTVPVGRVVYNSISKTVVLLEFEDTRKKKPGDLILWSDRDG